MNKLRLGTLSILLVSGLNGYELSETQSINGFVKIHSETQTHDKDTGYTMGSVGVGYSQTIDNNLKFNISGLGNIKISEQNDAYDDDANKLGLRELNIAYKIDNNEFIVGRQELDLEWIGDYHNAILSKIDFDNISLQAGISIGNIVLNDDSALEKYNEIKDKDNKDSFLYFFDTSYTNNILTLNPYLFGVADLFVGYGLKAETTIDQVDLIGHYAQSNEESQENGSIFNFEVGYKSDLNINIGYIQTSTNGIGSLSEYGDNISPLEEGNQVYEANSKTVYIGLSKEIDRFTFNGMYGNSTTNLLTEQEVDFSSGYTVNDNLELEVIYSYTNNDTEITNNFKANLTYSF